MSKKPIGFRGFPFKKYDYQYFTEPKDIDPIIDKYCHEDGFGVKKRICDLSKQDITDMIVEIVSLCLEQVEDCGEYCIYEDESGEEWKYEVDGKLVDVWKFNEDIIDHWSDIMSDWITESAI